jgi:hypothetical protein
MAAAGAMLTAIFSHSADVSGLRADWGSLVEGEIKPLE